MTVHELHDALNLLPGDLITAVDKLRTAPKEQRRVERNRKIKLFCCCDVLRGWDVWLALS